MPGVRGFETNIDDESSLIKLRRLWIVDVYNFEEYFQNFLLYLAWFVLYLLSLSSFDLSTHVLIQMANFLSVYTLFRKINNTAEFLEAYTTLHKK